MRLPQGRADGATPEPGDSAMNQDKAESDHSHDTMHSDEAMQSNEATEEGQRLRRLQFMMNLVMQVIAKDPRLPPRYTLLPYAALFPSSRARLAICAAC